MAKAEAAAFAKAAPSAATAATALFGDVSPR